MILYPLECWWLSAVRVCPQQIRILTASKNPMSAMVAVPKSAMTGAPEETPADEHAGPAAVPKAKARGRPKAQLKGRIDIDERIDAARATVRAAAKAMGTARALARLEKKRKNRLTRKASQLSAEDLERIAVLKRTGMWAPELAEPVIERLSIQPPPTTATSSTTASAVAPLIDNVEVFANSADAEVMPKVADGDTTDDGMGAPDQHDVAEADLD